MNPNRDQDSAPVEVDPLSHTTHADHADQITNQVDKTQIAQFVSTIRNAEEQVGRHIIEALQHDDTVAVITTIAASPDGKQRVISAALSPKRLKQVQEILQSATLEREEEEPCVGFHCLVKPKLPIKPAEDT